MAPATAVLVGFALVLGGCDRAAHHVSGARPAGVGSREPTPLSPWPASEDFDVVTQLPGPVCALVPSGQGELWYAVTGDEVVAVYLALARQKVEWRQALPEEDRLERPRAFPTPGHGIVVGGLVRSPSSGSARARAAGHFPPDARAAVVAYAPDGTREWSVERKWGARGDGWLGAWPIMVAHLVFLDGDDLVAVDVRTGKPTWTAAGPIEVLWGGQGVVVCGVERSGLGFWRGIVGFDAATGRALWHRALQCRVFARVLPVSPARSEAQRKTCWLAEGDRAWCLETTTGRVVHAVALGSGKEILGVYERKAGPILVGRTYQAGAGASLEAWNVEGEGLWLQPLLTAQGVGTSMRLESRMGREAAYAFNESPAAAIQVIGVAQGKNLAVVRVNGSFSYTPLIAESGGQVAIAAGREVAVLALPSYEPVVTIATPERHYYGGATVLQWVSDGVLAAGTSSGYVLVKGTVPSGAGKW